jgi:hypothetical protein
VLEGVVVCIASEEVGIRFDSVGKVDCRKSIRSGVGSNPTLAHK